MNVDTENTARLSVLPLVFALAIMVLLGTLGKVYGQREATLSDDGEVVTVGKVPDALKMASFSNHLGLIRPGTRVLAFESKRDPVIPATWIKVKILEGEYEGKVGWALSPTVHLQEAKPDRGTDSRTERRVDSRPPTGDISPSEEGDGRPPRQSTHRVSATTALFTSPSIYGVGGEQVQEGSWVESLDAKDDAITSFRWIQVRILTGEQRSKTAWVPSHTLKRRLLRCVIIANQADEKSWTLATKLARHAEVDLVATQDLEILSDSSVDLSNADEIVILEHSYGPALPGAICSADSPRSLAEKLRKGGARRDATVELLICKAGAKVDGNPSFAAQLAKALGAPVRAYLHYVRVETSKSDFGVVNTAKLKGYEYKEIDPFSDEQVQVSVPVKRHEFDPSGSVREIGGVAEMLRKNGSES